MNGTGGRDFSCHNRPALIVIDVQNEYVTGNPLIEYPDVALSLSNIGQAIEAARASGVPVVVVQNTEGPGAPVFAEGTAGWELHEVVASREGQSLTPIELLCQREKPCSMPVYSFDGG